MKIIFTKEDKKTARRGIENFRRSYVINAREIILEFDYREGDTIDSPYDFIINKELEKRLQQAIVNRRSTQVVYFHYVISRSLISNVKSFFKENGVREIKYALFDPNNELSQLHGIFDEVIR
jgi:hypothetical protein